MRCQSLIFLTKLCLKPEDDLTLTFFLLDGGSCSLHHHLLFSHYSKILWHDLATGLSSLWIKPRFSHDEWTKGFKTEAAESNSINFALKKSIFWWWSKEINQLQSWVIKKVWSISPMCFSFFQGNNEGIFLKECELGLVFQKVELRAVLWHTATSIQCTSSSSYALTSISALISLTLKGLKGRRRRLVDPNHKLDGYVPISARGAGISTQFFSKAIQPSRNLNVWKLDRAKKKRGGKTRLG